MKREVIGEFFAATREPAEDVQRQARQALCLHSHASEDSRALETRLRRDVDAGGRSTLLDDLLEHSGNAGAELYHVIDDRFF